MNYTLGTSTVYNNGLANSFATAVPSTDAIIISSQLGDTAQQGFTVVWNSTAKTLTLTSDSSTFDFSTRSVHVNLIHNSDYVGTTNMLTSAVSPTNTRLFDLQTVVPTTSIVGYIISIRYTGLAVNPLVDDTWYVVGQTVFSGSSNNTQEFTQLRQIQGWTRDVANGRLDITATQYANINQAPVRCNRVLLGGQDVIDSPDLEYVFAPMGIDVSPVTVTTGNSMGCSGVLNDKSKWFAVRNPDGTRLGACTYAGGTVTGTPDAIKFRCIVFEKVVQGRLTHFPNAISLNVLGAQLCTLDPNNKVQGTLGLPINTVPTRFPEATPPIHMTMFGGVSTSGNSCIKVWNESFAGGYGRSAGNGIFGYLNKLSPNTIVVIASMTGDATSGSVTVTKTFGCAGATYSNGLWTITGVDINSATADKYGALVLIGASEVEGVGGLYDSRNHSGFASGQPYPSSSRYELAGDTLYVYAEAFNLRAPNTSGIILIISKISN